ncbi:MAG: hypothetical protein KAH93_02140 [Candidatus Aenigmarchaeota archaeon]|nr:hypothetical protein [Candidatus Aenigmarchaeota archaeon]
MKIYGPVPSWRLGNSLGVDLVDAPKGYCKICPYDCLYCHLGHKGALSLKPVATEMASEDFDILEKKIDETKPDYVTFSGQGEPTLNLNLGQAAQRIKKMCDVPVAVLTNACFASRKDVRAGLDNCDVVIAKIDAPTQQLFEKINQPASSVKLADIVDGIKLINTKVCIQTLIFSCGSVTNADDETLNALLDVYRDINKSRPIEVLLGTVTRPSDDGGLRPVTSERLSEIADRITKECGIKARYFRESEKEQKNIRRKISPDQLRMEITGLLLRRPCTRDEIISRFDGSDAAIVLDRLAGKKVLGLKVLDKKKYYVIL